MLSYFVVPRAPPVVGQPTHSERYGHGGNMKIKTWVLVCGLIAYLLAKQAGADELSAAYSAYFNGNYAIALKLMMPLAEKGNANAQFILGYMYETGHVASKDYAEAAKWYRRAADQGDAISQISLGCLYENGHGVPQDYAEAARWYRRAADQGSASAHFSLGIMYRYGHGVPQDLVLAHMYFDIAAAGFTVRPAADARHSVANQMTSAQLAEARHRAREWLTAHPPAEIGPSGNIQE